jgi:Glycosyl transferase family 2
VSEVAVSAVLAVDRLETGREALDALRRQTLAERLELVLVGPGVEPEAGLADGFGGLVAVDVPIHPLSSARAAGVAASRGRAVFVAETHGFPRPDCLEELLAVIDAGAAAAMPRLANANPETARSYASLFATYAAFTGSTPERVRGVALHNAMFRREALVRAAWRPSALVYGVGVSRVLEREGAEMRFVPSAVIDHLNVVRPRGVVADRLTGGRMWAAVRSGTWSGPRRVAHALGAPLAPVVMAGRIFGSSGWRDLRPETPRWTGALVVAYAALQACGEAAGYLRGAGDTERRHLDLELHREAYI